MKCIEWNDELNFLFCFCAAEKKTAVIRLLFVTISISLICMHIEIGPILCIQLHLTKSKNTNTQIKPQNTYTEIEIRLADKCSLAYNRLLRASWLSQVLSFFFFILNITRCMARQWQNYVCVQKNCWHEFLLLFLLSFERLSVWPINMSKFKWNEHTHMNSLHTLSEIIGIAFWVPHTQIRTHNRNN